MRVEDMTTGSRPYYLRRAVLLYEAENGSAFASVNPVRRRNKKATIGAGRCLSRDALAELNRELAGLPSRRELLPPHVLFADGSRTLWYRPAHRAPIFFNTGSKKLDSFFRGKQVLYPPLLFLAMPQNLYAWGLGSDDRPSGETHLYRAPCLNLYGDGHMCAGTSKLPLEVSTDVRLFEKAFFDTAFSHSNLGGQELCRYAGGHDALWKALADPEVTPDWPAWLAPLRGKSGPLTAAEVLNR
ncbi:MAG: PRTRC system protein B [Armatimonadota bacterium]